MTADIATIDVKTALELLDAAVELAGADHKYEPIDGVHGCRYVHGDNPGCIIGVALSIHGVPLDTLKDWDDLNPQGLTIGSIANEHQLAPFLTPNALAIFAEAQRIQDAGALQPAQHPTFTWGAARDSATHLAAAWKLSD